MSNDINIVKSEVSAINRRDTLRMVASAALWGVSAAHAQSFSAGLQDGPERFQPFDDQWHFFHGDGEGFETPGFSDEAWRTIDLPHDWSIEDLPPLATSADNALWGGANIPSRTGPFDHAAIGGVQAGFAVGGVGWYRKRFHVPNLNGESRVEILFDGIFMNSDVWLNGHHLGNHAYGYTAFGYDLTPYLKATGDNLLAVRVRNVGQTGRWYSGSGIYRPVKLFVTGPVRFARWGVSITTPQVSSSSARIVVETEIEGGRPDTTLTTRVFDPSGKMVSELKTAADAKVEQSISVSHPHLWSPETPLLYRLDMELRAGEVVLDRQSNSFGVRNVEMDAKRGLRINGRPYKLRGGCIHHDNGLLGAAAFSEADERRVALLKARGFNAIRTSHNPPSTTFLDACDRLGMLVMEEAFDVWNEGKNPDDYHKAFKDEWRTDLAAMILRDRNHPCVILWSIGNEIPERLKPEGNKTAWMLAEEVRRLDPTRPITAAVNGFSGRPVIGHDGKPDQPVYMWLDVAGYNYKWPEYLVDHAQYPNRVMVGTESYPREAYQNWTLIEKSPWVIGDFVWTGMDHLGEAGLGMTSLRKAGDTGPAGSLPDWPWIINNSGDIDLIGEQKPQSLARDVIWGLSPVEITVQRPVPKGMQESVGWASYSDELASWTWPGSEAAPFAVRVHTMGDKVELRLNGASLGVKKLGPADIGMAQFEVPYAPGELIAIAWRGGRKIGQRVLATAGVPSALRLKSYRASMSRSRNGLAFVTVEVIDAAGRLIPDATIPLHATVNGPADLVAFGSANPRRPASFQSSHADTYHGRALVILRGRGNAGRVFLQVNSEGTSKAEIVIPVT